jgi:hypothetical protein
MELNAASSYCLDGIGAEYRDFVKEEIEKGYMDPDLIASIEEKQILHKIVGHHVRTKRGKHLAFESETRHLQFSDGTDFIYYQISQGVERKALTLKEIY